ncbi:MAG TPA: UMP kinase [Phycisphaerae bacterium]|nr:UMP kinase [Phycisphaerae bacterium]
MAKRTKAADGKKRKSEAPRYQRVLLKISGEGFGQPGQLGIDGEAVRRIAREIISVRELKVDVAVVVGGGNFIRGTTLASQAGIQEATAHYMGMLATVINALALQDVLEDLGQPTRVQSSIPIHSACENFIRLRCIRHLEKGRVVILAAGTGRPFVTTDTAAALASVEIGADILFKATKVDGVYTADPVKDKSAKFLPKLSYNQVIDDRLKVMDVSAVDMCQRHGVPIRVFNLMTPGNMRKAVLGRDVGTMIVD